MSERTSPPVDTRGTMTDVEQFEAGEARFRRVRELGQRGVFRVLHPHTYRSMDVVDFDIEIARRHELGLEAHSFWSTPLPEVDKQ